MTDAGEEPLDTTISVRISRAAAVYYESLPHGEKGKTIDGFLLTQAAKDPRGLSTILRGKAKQAEFHKAALKDLDAETKELTHGRYASIFEWFRAEGAPASSEDIRARDGAAVLANIVRMFRKRHENGGEYRRSEEVRWARNVLSNTGRTLDLTPEALLARCERDLHKGGGA